MINACHIPNRLGEIIPKLILSDAAKSFVASVHTDVVRLVETAEHAYLREFCHSGKKNKLEMTVRHLKHGIESFQNVAVLVFKTGICIQNIQDRLVVLVYQDYGTTACLLMYRTKYITKTKSDSKFRVGMNTILFFPFVNIIIKHGLQYTCLSEIRPVEIHMKYRMYIPVLL